MSATIKTHPIMMTSTIKKNPNIRQHLSDGTWYETHIQQSAHLITFRHTCFDELTTILNDIESIIKAYAFNHIFINDIRIILNILENRRFPNNWAICITKAELQDIRYRLDTLLDYISTVCFPAVTSKVTQFFSAEEFKDEQTAVHSKHKLVVV